jgi:hypothetical protein
MWFNLINKAFILFAFKIKKLKIIHRFSGIYSW